MKGLWMAVDAVLFAILSAALISLVAQPAPDDGVHVLLLSTQTEDLAQVAALHPGDVTAACSEKRPSALQARLAAALQRFSFGCFELSCPDGSTVVLGGTRCSAPARFSFSTSRVIVSDDGQRIFAVDFRASR